MNPTFSIRYLRRDDRAAEGARLEVVCTRKGTEGSNPSLSVAKNLTDFLLRSFTS